MKSLRRDDLSTEQAAAVEELTQRRRASLWAKPGSGKTVVAATAVSDMFEGPTLVVATKRICELVWRQELDRWAHLQHLDARLVMHSRPVKRAELLEPGADFYIINYELIPWLAEELKGAPWPFRSVIFDEVSKLKWPGTRRFKRLRAPVQEIPVRIGLTGTPRGNAILGLWGQTFVTCAVKGGEVPLASSMARYKAKWFQPVDDKRRVWRPLSGAEKEIRDLAHRYAYSVPRSTAAPEAKITPVPVSVPPKVRKLYAQLEADLSVTIDGHEIVGIEPSVNRGKRLQLCSGAIYTDHERKDWIRIHDAKIEALVEIVEEMQGAPLLVFYRFVHELDRMREAIPGLKTVSRTEEWIRDGGTLAVHPESAAHGLNLHVGGCSRSVWFTLPDSQELWEQGNRRLARKGQTESVVSMVLAIQNTIEDTVSRNLQEHGRLQDELIDAA